MSDAIACYGTLRLTTRMVRRGWAPQTVRAAHLAHFHEAFAALEDQTDELFSDFFDREPYTHGELLEFALNPRSLSSTAEQRAGSRCLSLIRNSWKAIRLPLFDRIFPSGNRHREFAGSALICIGRVGFPQKPQGFCRVPLPTQGTICSYRDSFRFGFQKSKNLQSSAVRSTLSASFRPLLA